jgi:hypothetical protein
MEGIEVQGSGIEHWNPLNFMEDGLDNMDSDLFVVSPTDSEGGNAIFETPPQQTPAEQCAYLISRALRTWNSAEDIESLRALVESMLTTEDMVLELFRQLSPRPVNELRLITARLADAGFRISARLRTLLRTQMIQVLQANMTPAQRKSLLLSIGFLNDVYAITTITDLRSHVRDPEAHEQMQKRLRLIRDYYTIRDELASLGLWVDSHVQGWRTWPSRARQPIRASIDMQSAFLQFTATLSPMLLPTADSDVRLAYANTIIDAQLATGGLLRLADFQTRTQPVLRRSVYAHLINLVEQMAVRALDHLQFVVLDGRKDGYIGRCFEGGVRRNWVTPLIETFVFVTPLTRLASERDMPEDVLHACRELSYLLLPEVLQERVLVQDGLLVHAGGIRVRVQELEGPVSLVRDLVAQGNRDGRRPFDVRVSVLPLDRKVRLHVLAFLVNLGQVWARRLILEEPLAVDGLNTPAFWTDSSLWPMWPLFRPIQEDTRTLHCWFPHPVERVRGREPLVDLLTLSKENLAPSDSNPSFPRGLYGATTL